MLSRLGPLAGTRALPSPYQARDRWGEFHFDRQRAPGTGTGYRLFCGRRRARCLFLYGGEAVLGGGAMGTPVGGFRNLSGSAGTAENKRALGRSRG